MRRMDRYKDESTEPKLTRSDQNKDLYESIGNNTRYTSFSDVTNANAIDISSKKNYNTREGYHQMKEFLKIEYFTLLKINLIIGFWKFY